MGFVLYDEFEKKIREVLPKCQIETDNYGQIIIYTNKVELSGKEVWDMDDPEVQLDPNDIDEVEDAHEALHEK
jgi:hypothetical protein